MIAPTLPTSRLALRALDPDALSSDYVRWMEDPEVNRYLESRFVRQTEQSVREYVRQVNLSSDSYQFGIFLSSSQTHIGNIKLGPINSHHKRGDIGLLIGNRACWGKGFAAEAIAAVTEFALVTLGLHKVTAGCYADNEGSRRAFLRVGYKEIGRMVDHWSTASGWNDQILLERLAPY